MLDAFSKDGVFCLEAVTRSTAVCSKEDIQPFFPHFTLILLLLLFLMEEKFQRNCADSVEVTQTRDECTVLNTSIHYVVVGMTYLHEEL